MERLLSRSYAAERAALAATIGRGGRCRRRGSPGPDGRGAAVTALPQPQLDTSYVCVVDRHGNAFSATPSDVSSSTPVIPGTGLCPSSRGSQSWADPSLPASVAPGKRPRLTPSPALALGADGRAIPFGTPGGDVQAQAMLQTLLNRIVFGMDPQAAVEAPRFATYSFPDSFEPHSMQPAGWCWRRACHRRWRMNSPASATTWRGGRTGPGRPAICMIDSDPGAGLHRQAPIRGGRRMRWGGDGGSGPGTRSRMSSSRSSWAISRRRFLEFLAASPLLARGSSSAGAQGVPSAIAREAENAIADPSQAINVFDFEPVMRKNVPAGPLRICGDGARR